MHDAIRSQPGICTVEVFRGASAPADAVPDLLLEVAHGATRASDFDSLRQALVGEYAPDLREFYFVNTDVGAPEVAAAVAAKVVATQPRRTALVVRCLIPRTFIDCNRRIDPVAIEPGTAPAATPAGAMTPGLPPWVREPRDQQLLLDRYTRYREVVTAAFAQVCGNGGLGLCVHTYAPRSIDVAVDADIMSSLRAAYAPERLSTWPLRAPVDLITRDPDGRELAAIQLAHRAQAEYAAAGYEVVQNGAYSLHPITLAHAFATAYPGRTLCLELRRDLLLHGFTPFVELHPEPSRVERTAAPLAAAVLGCLA